MPSRILLGPLLGLEGDSRYTICLLSSKDTEAPQAVVDGTAFPAALVEETPRGVLWRAEVDVSIHSKGRFVSYRIESGQNALKDPESRSAWNFWIPGRSEEPRIAYASCNGFSDGDMKTKLEDPYRMWKVMRDSHESAPFSLLIMGGDQLYADEIWHSRARAPSLVRWARLPLKDRIEAAVTPRLRRELDSFYEDVYVRHWNQEAMSGMMASIPSLMMWDDHDIFDGWGSYPSELQNCPVYQAVFAAARRYFELFQLRSSRNATLLRRGGTHFSFGLRFRKYAILGLDNRSNRSETAVMNDQNWSDVKGWLSDLRKRLQPSKGSISTLLVLAANPVVYRDLRTAETVFDVTPWQEELTDDIRDQWRSRHHEGERMKLIMNLMEVGGRPTQSLLFRKVILSGDVHVGCLGIIERSGADAPTRTIHQVVSSAIVHPAPSWYQWAGVLVGSSDEPESLEGGTITAAMIKPYGADKYLRTRNFAALQEGTDGKLWVTWFCENGAKAEYPIAN